MGIWIEKMPDGFVMNIDGLILDDVDVEIHSRKNARKLAEAFGCMKAYRRKRLEIRHEEKARKARLRGGVGGAGVALNPKRDKRHLRHPACAKTQKR